MVRCEGEKAGRKVKRALALASAFTDLQRVDLGGYSGGDTGDFRLVDRRALNEFRMRKRPSPLCEG